MPVQSEASYVIPGTGSTYLAQPVAQLSPSHSGHASAYSALSASLASLKNRLNARGVSLSGQLSEVNGSNLYPSSASSYASSVIVDPQQPSQAQSQSQPTYLSVTTNQQEPVNAYAGSHNQSNDNKTIVLAIPAKINFLTGDARSSSTLAKQQQQQQVQQQQQQQQVQQQQAQHIQPQQLTVLQSSPDQPRPEYAIKQQISEYSKYILSFPSSRKRR